MKEYKRAEDIPCVYIGEASTPYIKYFNTATRWLFWTLMDLRDKDNKAKLIIQNRTEANKLSAGYKVLFDLGWIRRTKRQHYFINPDIALSSLDLYWDLKEEWNKGIT